MGEQPGHKVLAFALPDQVDVLDLIVASLSNSFVLIDKHDNVQGDFFHWYPPKKLKYVKPRLGESTST